MQVEEGLAVAVAVEESAAPSPSSATIIVEEEQAITETTAPSGLAATGRNRLRWRERGDGACRRWSGATSADKGTRRRNIGGAGVFTGRNRGIDRGRGGHVYVLVPDHLRTMCGLRTADGRFLV
jgi:hypothetical protein